MEDNLIFLYTEDNFTFLNGGQPHIILQLENDPNIFLKMEDDPYLFFVTGRRYQYSLLLKTTSKKLLLMEDKWLVYNGKSFIFLMKECPS